MKFFLSSAVLVSLLSPTVASSIDRPVSEQLDEEGAGILADIPIQRTAVLTAGVFQYHPNFSEDELDFVTQCFLDSYNDIVGPSSRHGITLTTAELMVAGPTTTTDLLPDRRQGHLHEHDEASGQHGGASSDWLTQFGYPFDYLYDGYSFYIAGHCRWCPPDSPCFIFDDDDRCRRDEDYENVWTEHQDDGLEEQMAAMKALEGFEEFYADTQKRLTEFDEVFHPDWAKATCECLRAGPFELFENANDCQLYIPPIEENGYLSNDESTIIQKTKFRASFQTQDFMSDAQKDYVATVIKDSYNELHSADEGYIITDVRISDAGAKKVFDFTPKSDLPWNMKGFVMEYDLTTFAKCVDCDDACTDDDDVVFGCDDNKKVTIDNQQSVRGKATVPDQPHHLQWADKVCEKLQSGTVESLTEVHGCVIWFMELPATTAVVDEKDFSETESGGSIEAIMKALGLSRSD